MKSLILYITILINVLAMAKDKEAIVQRALKAYNQQDYQTAIRDWQMLLKDLPLNADLHYNIANAYYQNNQLGWSVFHYEKALKIQPNYDQAQINLALAQRKNINPIKGSFPISKQELFYKTLSFLSIDTWAAISVVFSILVLVSFASYYFSKQSAVKKGAFVAMIAFVVATALSTAITLCQTNYFHKKSYGVVVLKEIMMLNQPRVSSTIMRNLSQGTKVQIIDGTPKWIQVRLANDSIGWIKKEDVEEI